MLAYRWIGELEGWERVGRRRRVLADWEQKVGEQFERDGAEIHAAMKALGFTRVAELKEALGRLADADQVVAEWRRRRDEWEASPEATEGKRERAAVEAQIRDLEARLSEDAGGFVRDVRSVESEIQRMEADAAAPPAAAAPPPPPVTAAPVVDPLRALLERAGTELKQSPAAAARAVAQKASAHLAGLTFQRLSALQVDDRGNLAAVTGGRPTPASTLSMADRDLLWLALKLAFLERALVETRSVAVVDDAFAGLAEGSRRFVARLLKQLAKPGQIVHATSDPAFKEAADHVA
ncbi:MAG: ABC transporter ATP-binding protein [Anaeromyxobacteraceae bacterium]